jgi:hypothetical protein
MSSATEEEEDVIEVVLIAEFGVVVVDDAAATAAADDDDGTLPLAGPVVAIIFVLFCLLFLWLLLGFSFKYFKTVYISLSFVGVVKRLVRS